MPLTCAQTLFLKLCIIKKKLLFRIPWNSHISLFCWYCGSYLLQSCLLSFSFSIFFFNKGWTTKQFKLKDLILLTFSIKSSLGDIIIRLLILYKEVYIKGRWKQPLVPHVFVITSPQTLCIAVLVDLTSISLGFNSERHFSVVTQSSPFFM